jgi:integrase
VPCSPSDEPDPPTAAQTRAILERVGPRWRLPLIVLEQTAMRAGEAAKLVWGDVDVAESKFRLPRRSTKSSRRVFPGFSVDGAEKAMASACKAAGIPRYSAHSLRHRRATIWHHDGVPTKALAERVGHADAQSP